MALYPGFYPGPTAYPGGADDGLPKITATPQPDNNPPRVLLQVLNAGAAVSSGQVLRYGGAEQPIPVRQGDPAALSSGSWVGFDYEVRYNQPARWEFTPANGAARLVSATTQLDVDRPWLVHPGVPSLSQPVTVKLLDDETMRASGSLHDVLEAEFPVPVTGGRRKAPAFQMLLRTGTKAERDGLDQLFYDEAPLLLQTPYPQLTDEAEYRWIWAGDITRARLAPQVYANGTRVWTLPCTEVGRPLGGIRAQRTRATLMLECATRADTMAKYLTRRGALTGIPGI